MKTSRVLGAHSLLLLINSLPEEQGCEECLRFHSHTVELSVLLEPALNIHTERDREDINENMQIKFIFEGK